MDDERREYIRDRFYQETNEPESQEWRDDLTPEELEYIAPVRIRLSGHMLRHSGAGEGPGAVPPGGDRGGGDHPGPLPGAVAGRHDVPGPAGPGSLPAVG